MTSTNKVPVLCRFGGNFIWESNKVYYKEGTNRIVHVDRGINYLDLLSKVHGICKLIDISSIQYKYPGLDLDSLVSIENDDDVSNMMEAFPQSSEPIHLFIFRAQNFPIPVASPSFLMQNANNGNDQASLQDLHGSNGTLAPADNGNDQASLWDLHGKNGTLAPSPHDTNANNNDVPSATNDLSEMNRVLIDDRELSCEVVDTSVNEMPEMMPVLKEGQEFVDANAFHKSLREYAIRSHFEYKRTRSGRGHYHAKCIKGDCSWRIHACKLPDKPTFKIKSLKGNHTCNVLNKSTISNTTTHRQASRRWIAALVKDRLQKNLHYKPKDIVNEISQEYGIKVSYDKAWRGIELVIKERRLEQSVSALRKLCEEIQATNQGSMAKLSRSSDNSLRLFVAYKAAINGFKQACRPNVMLDCTKMEGKCGGVWLFAMAFDAEENLFPVSCAFVESKNIGSWKWFCDELGQVLRCIPKLTFISNRQEGILEVVSRIFPDACHQYCQVGLVEEIQQKFRYRDLVGLFESAVYAGVRSKFHAWDKLEGWRDPHITSVLVNLHGYMIEIFNERFDKSSNWDTILVPTVEAFISDSKMRSKHYSVSRSAAEFEVLYKDDADANPLKVDLKRQTCSCLYWQMQGYPCEHAIAAIRYSGGKVYDYVDVHYRVGKYRETYSEVIHPLHSPNPRLSQQKKRKYVESNEVSLTDWLQ